MKCLIRCEFSCCIGKSSFRDLLVTSKRIQINLSFIFSISPLLPDLRLLRTERRLCWNPFCSFAAVHLALNSEGPSEKRIQRRKKRKGPRKLIVDNFQGNKQEHVQVFQVSSFAVDARCKQVSQRHHTARQGTMHRSLPLLSLLPTVREGGPNWNSV